MNHHLIAYLSNLYQRIKLGTIEEIGCYYVHLHMLMETHGRWSSRRDPAQLLLKSFFNLTHLAARHDGRSKVSLDEWAASNQLVASWQASIEQSIVKIVDDKKSHGRINKE